MKKILIFLIVLFIGCQDDLPDTGQLSKIYVHDLLARQQYGKDYKTYRKHFREILNEYGYTEDVYLADLEKLNNDRENWETFFSESLEYLKKLKTKADSSKQ